MNIVYLKISTFRGISIGAEHYYGKLIFMEPYLHHELSYTMTQEDAVKLNDKDPDWPYHSEGEKSTRFDSKDLVREAAIKYCTEKWNDDEYVLVESDPISPFNRKRDRILSGIRPVWAYDATDREIDKWLKGY